MKNIMLLCYLVTGLLWACSEEKIPVYNDAHYVQFVNAYTDSLETSFFFYGTATEIDIALPVKLVGMPLTEAKRIVAQANPAYTTAEASQYVIPEDAMFAAGQTVDTLHVILKRNGLDKKVRLVVDLVNGEDLLSGQSIYSRQIIWFSTEVSRPEWWDADVEENLLGAYSVPKYQKLIEVTGEGDWTDVEYDQRRAYALELKRALLELRYAGTPYPDPELGLTDMSLDIPVRGY